MIIQHHHWRLHPAAPLCPRGCLDDQVRWNERPKKNDSKQSQDPICLQGLPQREIRLQEMLLEHVQASAQRCKLLRFCCKEHLRRSQPIDSEKRGPREGMTPPQLALLVDILLKSGAPWAVPLVLLQIVTGERSGCMTISRVRWLDLVFLPIDHRKGHGEDTRAFHCPHSMVARSHRILAS